MDFETMRKNIDNHQYRTMDEFETDFEQIIKNCMKYNAKDTVFYRAATRLRDQVGLLLLMLTFVRFFKNALVIVSKKD